MKIWPRVLTSVYTLWSLCLAVPRSCQINSHSLSVRVEGFYSNEPLHTLSCDTSYYSFKLHTFSRIRKLFNNISSYIFIWWCIPKPQFELCRALWNVTATVHRQSRAHWAWPRDLVGSGCRTIGLAGVFDQSHWLRFFEWSDLLGFLSNWICLGFQAIRLAGMFKQFDEFFFKLLDWLEPFSDLICCGFRAIGLAVVSSDKDYLWCNTNPRMWSTGSWSCSKKHI